MPSPSSSSRLIGQPASYAVDYARQYADVLSGHPDSGKAVTREFTTVVALLKYVQERTQAALRYYASNKQRTKT